MSSSLRCSAIRNDSAEASPAAISGRSASISASVKPSDCAVRT